LNLFKFFILGILTALLFPPFFMLPLGLVIFPYFIKLLSKTSNKKSLFIFFNYGFSFGLGFLLFLLCWIYNPFLVYESTRNFAALSILLPIFLSLFFGFGFCIYKFLRSDYLILILTPFIFLIIEFIISNIFYGFPWISFSLILSNNLLGFYILKYFGIYVASYLILFFFTTPILFFFNFKLINKKNLIVILHLPFVLVLIILYIFNSSSESKYIKELSLEINQIASPIKNVDRKKVEKNIIEKIKNSNSEILIFAENNFPYIISDNNIFNLTKHINNNKIVIIGITRERENKLYNSFLFLEKDNVQYFDKKILVPFGEFLPFRKYFKFMEKITGNVDFNFGENNRLITSKENLNILPIICYEIIFNEIFNNITQNKIHLLINITNDSWFGNHIGPYQHFYLARIRALISNKPLVRVSNNGISAIIDDNGKIINYLELNQKRNLKNKLKISNKTYYNLSHRLFSIYLIFLFIIFLILNYFNINEKK